MEPAGNDFPAFRFSTVGRVWTQLIWCRTRDSPFQDGWVETQSMSTARPLMEIGRLLPAYPDGPPIAAIPPFIVKEITVQAQTPVPLRTI